MDNAVDVKVTLPISNAYVRIGTIQQLRPSLLSALCTIKGSRIHFNEFYLRLVIVCHCYFHSFGAISFPQLIIINENKGQYNKSHSAKMVTETREEIVVWQQCQCKFDSGDKIMACETGFPSKELA